jgi:DNA-binding transcriptional LysR family regulator
MTLRQLEVFLAIAHAHSYRQAAEGLHTSQPALSQHVRELEAELGVRLFDRLSRGVVPTEAGRLLEERAKRVFATLTDVREVLGELQGLQRGSLLVGARVRRRGSMCCPLSSESFDADIPGSTCGCGSPTRA